MPAHAAHERLTAGDRVRFALKTTRGDLRSGDLKGTTYAVLFWNVSSKRFADALPDLANILKKTRGKKFALLGYNVDDSAAKVAAYVKANGLPWPQALASEQDFPFYDLFYRRRAVVPGVFLISDTGELLWFGPISQLPEQVDAALALDAHPAGDSPVDRRAIQAAAVAAGRAAVKVPPDPDDLFKNLRAIPVERWTDDPVVLQHLRRAAIRLARLSPPQQLTLDAAATTDGDRDLLARLRALPPAASPTKTEPNPAESASPPAVEADPADPAREALARAVVAEAQGDLLTAWEQYAVAADDPQGAQAALDADAARRRLDAQPDFAARLIAAGRERAASNLYVKAINLLAANQPRAAETVLREIRREYYDTSIAPAVERAIEQLTADPTP